MLSFPESVSMRRFSEVFGLTIGAIAPLILAGCGGSAGISQTETSPGAIATSPGVSQAMKSPAIRVSPSPEAAIGAPSNGSPSPVQSPGATTKAEIWSQMQQGKGYVILFRHALAPGTGDPPNFRLEDCSTQRNLSDEGRRQAVRIGETLRQQNIKVFRVLSSQWCRCLETAQLMNVGQVEPFPVLNSFFQDRSTERSQTEQLRQFILENYDNAGVTVMVTHQVNITAISDVVPQSGSAVVLRAIAPDQITFVGQLSP